jgi:fused signal recognition particle receptor
MFNWFRRQHSAPSADPKVEENPDTPVEQEAESETSTSAEETQSTAADDLLSFAKAAYKNIQKQQQPQLEVEKAREETSEATEEGEEPTEHPAAESGKVEEERPQAVTDSTTTEISEPSSATNTVPDSSNSEAELPKESTPLPFWAQAEADRQARLERLRQAAIEETEPAVVASVARAAEPTTEVREDLVEASATPEIAFDEGFLWSTEVLAAQGRRPEDVSVEEITWLKKLRQGLDKTRRNIVNQLKAIVGQGPLDRAAVAEIEALLLQADVGIEATDYIVNALQDQLRKEAMPPEAAIAYLKEILRDMLDRPLQSSHSPIFAPEKDNLNIWLIVGVNGAGKTTTIGKIAHIAQKSGYKCLIGAADTFRAAAVEQVKVWGARSGVEVISNPAKNTDPAAVVFDAISSAQARGTELLLIDTAGRLQNKKNLMDELSKVRRIVDKKAAKAKVESLLVLDATLGQNGLRQAEIFAEAAQLSGVVLTKLDGTAKGGIALAVVQQLGLPIRFIGAGEGIEDLRPFSSYEFVEALLSS